MKERSVVLIKGRNPAPDELHAIESLKAKGAFVRFVTIPTGWSDCQLEPCDVAYSVHKDLIEAYPKKVLLNGTAGEHAVPIETSSEGPTRIGPLEEESPWGAPLPRGHYVKKSGPYYRLINVTTGEQVNPKALHKKQMEQFILSLGGS